MAEHQPPSHSYRAIRATYTPTTITVYQAFPPEIANPALEKQTFVPPFSRTRMTWIKPSFLWMAYRSGWATKQRQERILAIEIMREGFEWTLRNSCLSHQDATTEDTTLDQGQWQQRLRASPVRIQWDPERDFQHRPLNHRAIQIGLGPEAVTRYVDEWIVSIVDVTSTMQEVKNRVDKRDFEAAKRLLPEEKFYSLSDELKAKVHAPF